MASVLTKTEPTFDTQPIAVIDGQMLNLGSLDQLVATARAHGCAGRGFSLFTLNLDHLVKRRADPAFRAAYARATYVTADGAPVVALARSQGASLQRTTGADLIEPLCAMAEREGLPLFFFGSTEAWLQAAAQVLLCRYPKLKIAGREAPPFGFDPASPAAQASADRIAASGARFCLVALGAPKQEMFVDAIACRCPEIGFFCIGAALDFIAGGQKRAPKWVRGLNLEWFWRMMTNPRRLAVRYARCALLLMDLFWHNPDGTFFRPARPAKSGA